MLCGSHIKIWNLANHMEKENKKHQNARFIDEKLKTKSLMFFVSFFHVICKISNFNKLYLKFESWTDSTWYILICLRWRSNNDINDKILTWVCKNMVSYGEFGNHMRKVFGNLHTLHIHHNLHIDAQNVQIPHNIHNMRQHQRLPPLQLQPQVQVWHLQKQWQIQGTKRSNNAENWQLFKLLVK